MKRKYLHPDYLYSKVKNCFDKIKDHRKTTGNVKISLTDALMSALAIFALKKPSLLSFERDIRAEKRKGRNLRHLFGIKTPPSDVQLRTILDPINPDGLRPAFRRVFADIQRCNALKEFRYLKEGYLLVLDGTGHFSSNKVKCNDCIEKKHSSGKSTYYHQLLGASIVHPDLKQVIPLCPEAVLNGDGEKKQDCELKAAKRWMDKFRAEHSKLEGVVLGDALFANKPFIDLLQEHNLHYILRTKSGRNKALFKQFELNKEHGFTNTLTKEVITGDRVKKKVVRTFNFINALSLTNKNPEVKVNMLEYTERISYLNPRDNKKNLEPIEKTFTWITDIELTSENVFEIMKAGRARWKQENENFQTLKEETGYNLEHSYGHGKKNLCTLFGMLAMLSFLIDQAQEIACPLFRKALKGQRANGTKRTLWGLFKSAVEWVDLDSWDTLLKLIAESIEVKTILTPVGADTS